MNIVREVQTMRPQHLQHLQQQQHQPGPRPPFPRPPPPPPRSYIGEFEWTFCRFCNVYRPPRAHHCHICRRCILLRDHHCPWINNCVGEFNQKYFLQFTSYACEFILSAFGFPLKSKSHLIHFLLLLPGIGSLYTIACIIISCLYSSVPSPPMKMQVNALFKEVLNVLIPILSLFPPLLHSSIHVALLVLASVIFGIFSVAVLCDQVTGIFNDQTNHERLNGRKGPKRGRLRALRATCGYISVFLWLLPLPIGGGGGGGSGHHRESKSVLQRRSSTVCDQKDADAAAASTELWRRDQLYAL